jgi:hypothetical protein
MASLSSWPNVYNTCLRILRQQGYKLRVEGEREADGSYPCEMAWLAEKDGETFHADNPIELLGLTKIYDYKQPIGELEPYWWSVEGENIWDELLDAAFPE